MSISESEYESSYFDSEGSSTGASSETNGTFASFYHALGAICEQLEEFEVGIESVQDCAHKMEQPITEVAVASFVQPAFLKTAPFSQERFRWTEEAKTLFAATESAAPFADICATIRQYLFDNGLVREDGKVDLGKEAAEDLKTLLETEETMTTFMGVLMHLDKFVE